ncbi:Alg9-like mannosyltransferase family protein [Clavispora lusitaniae]|uniref:Alg9-like mannosyltransferase family protein n=1 Tax=Clavispora lusitaniae TaxID=36911 RepID=UPI00202C2703|nr:Alg9-like mannosyltransferase family protein [Clavispora lusitaniae]
MSSKDVTEGEKPISAKESEPLTVEGESLGSQLLGTLLLALNIAVRIYSGLYMIISDCDETFNYWEPLNLIFRGFGKQTWEYSPAYAIRSYAFLIPYYILTFPLRDYIHLTGAQLPASAFFYYIRVVLLCGFTSFTEFRLFKSAKRNFGSHTANWFLLFSTVSTGMSHAGVALLPSSFAMNWVAWGISHALDAVTLENTLTCVWPSVYAIACFLIAGLVGWPFALALGVPFGMFTASLRFQSPPLVRIVIYCSIFAFALCGVLMTLDSFFYSRKMLFVPMNIVLYNVFAGEGEGPEIFGVEPFSYYAKNLFLNFNVISVAGYLGAALNPLLSKNQLKAALGVSLPLFVWSFIFFSQPHKEERFLYPIYPLISLSGSIFASTVFGNAQMLLKSKWLVRFISFSSMVLIAVVSLLRTVNLVENYSAPLKASAVFFNESILNDTTEIQNVCIGREWYHFPTSFFLPDNYRLRFVSSGFDGLLPGDFPEDMTLREAASAFPSGMNSKNIFSPEKLVHFSTCDYFIDNTSPVDTTKGEVQIVSMENGEIITDNDWDVLDCQKIIDPAGSHHGLGRLLYIPESLRTVVPNSVEYMDFCVLRRKK